MFLSVVILLIAASWNVVNANIGSSEHKDLLYPHMANNGDTELIPGDDVFKKLNTICKYKLYGEGTRNPYIGSNGYVTFKGGVKRYKPKSLDKPNKPMIAALWEDNYPDAPNAAGSHVWYRETQNQTLLDRARDDVRDNFQTDDCDASDFVPKCLLIVTWQRQESYCHNFGLPTSSSGSRREVQEEEDPPKDPNPQAAPRNGVDHPDNYYQLVWVTDEFDSYAMINILNINWTYCWNYGRAGFGDGTGTKCAELPWSGTEWILDLDTDTNVDVTGRWMYRTDKNSIKKPDCTNLPSCL